MNKPKVLILAGGLATRLRPITEKIPKALVEIKERPFIDYQLNLIKRYGFTEIVLCVGYKGKMIEDYLNDGSSLGLKIQYSYDGDKLLGTGGAIKKAFPMLSEDFIILYGDSFLIYDYDLVYKIYKEQKKKNHLLGLMTVFKNDNEMDKSNVVYSDGVIQVYDKVNRTPDMHYIDWGLGIINQRAFDSFLDKDVFDLADVYSNLVQNKLMAGHEVTQRFYEIGSHSGIEELQEYLSRNK